MRKRIFTSPNGRAMGETILGAGGWLICISQISVDTAIALGDLRGGLKMQVRNSKNDFATLMCAKQFLERHMAMLISRMSVAVEIALRDLRGGLKLQVRNSKNYFASVK